MTWQEFPFVMNTKYWCGRRVHMWSATCWKFPIDSASCRNLICWRALCGNLTFLIDGCWIQFYTFGLFHDFAHRLWFCEATQQLLFWHFDAHYCQDFQEHESTSPYPFSCIHIPCGTFFCTCGGDRNSCGSSDLIPFTPFHRCKIWSQIQLQRCLNPSISQLKVEERKNKMVVKTTGCKHAIHCVSSCQNQNKYFYHISNLPDITIKMVQTVRPSQSWFPNLAHCIFDCNTGNARSSVTTLATAIFCILWSCLVAHKKPLPFLQNWFKTTAQDTSWNRNSPWHLVFLLNWIRFRRSDQTENAHAREEH